MTHPGRAATKPQPPPLATFAPSRETFTGSLRPTGTSLIDALRTGD